MTENIFEGTTIPDAAPTTPVTSTLAVPTEIADLVGEGKKYKSVEDALKSVPHAQNHISTLEQENARIKAELESRRTTEELLEEIRSGITTTSQSTPTTTSIDPAQIESTINQLLERKEQQKAIQQNLSTVVSKFTETFGDKVKGEEAYNKLAQELGVDVPTLNRMAATSPQLVLRSAGITAQSKDPAPSKTTSSVNTDAFNQSNNTNELSAKVKMVGASTKDVTQAWKNAGEKARQKLNQS